MGIILIWALFIVHPDAGLSTGTHDRIRTRIHSVRIAAAFQLAHVGKLVHHMGLEPTRACLKGMALDSLHYGV
jgi:hypothetical protein